MPPNSSQQIFRRFGKNFITVSFSIALALLYVLVLRSLAVQISPPPPPITEPYPDTSTEELCAAAGGRWIKDAPAKSASPTRPVLENPAAVSYCQGPLAFERARDQQSERSRQASLFVFAIGGGVAVAAALLLPLLLPVAPGLMIGAIVSFFIAGVHIWTLAPGLGRLVTIVIIFLVLTAIGLKVFRDQGR